MYKSKQSFLAILGLCAALAGCKVPAIVPQAAQRPLPAGFTSSKDTANAASISWRNYFTDHYLVTLIDTALSHNQELLITRQEIEIARNEVRLRKGALLPTVGARGGAGVEKTGRYTSQGAGDATTEIAPGRAFPDPLTDNLIGLYANWEVDIWKKLRTAKKAAVSRYLASVAGRNFALTNLIAEVAATYYELQALDNQLAIVKQNIALQKNALEIVKVQKEAARATELGVQKFAAEVYKTESLEFDIRQQIIEAENKLNFLLGRHPQEIVRDSISFSSALPQEAHAGIPSNLLANRPDIIAAEHELTAARLDVQVARKEFYPSFGISAAVGLQAFNPAYLVKLPESLLFSLAGDLAGPLINRNAIKAEFYTANAKQLQALYRYERTILNAYFEVSGELSRIDNLEKGYELKARQVAALNRSVEISNDLFKSARVDYFEVLMTQRDVLEARLELVATRREQLTALVNVYRDLGGGWR